MAAAIKSAIPPGKSKAAPGKAAPRPDDSADRRWLRTFLIILALCGVLSIGTVAYYVTDHTPPPTDTQVPVSVTTAAGDGRLVQCNLNLVIAQKKEEELKARLPAVRAAVSEALGDTYQQTGERPNIQTMPETLRQAINNKLPPGLKVREVLIQHLLFGLS